MGIILYYLIALLPILLIFKSYYRNSSSCECYKFKPENPKYDWRMIGGVLFYSLMLSSSFETAADYVWYFDHYISEMHGQENEWGSGREVGYQLLVKVLAGLSNNPNTLFFFFAFTNMYVWTKLSSLYKNAAPFIIFMWFTYMFVLSLNLYRQYFAMASMMFAFYTFSIMDESILKNKAKIIIIFLSILLAFSFHTSSLIALIFFLIIYVFARYRINKYVFIISIALATIASSTILSSYINTFSLLVTMAQGVTDRSYDFSEILGSRWGDSQMTYVIMFCHIIFIWYADKYLTSDKHYRLVYYGMALSYILMPLSNQEILMRLRLYIDCIMVIAIGLTLFFSFNVKNRFTINPLIIAFLLEFAYKMFTLYNLGIVHPLTIILYH